MPLSRRDFAILEGAQAYTPLTGTVFDIDGTDLTKITGTGTLFTTEIAYPGGTIYLGSPVSARRVVDRIVSDTVLYVSRPFTVSTGSTAAQHLFLGRLLDWYGINEGIPNPASSFQEYSKSVNLGNGLVRGMGWPLVSWHWASLSALDRDSLRGQYPTPEDRSGIASIRTRVNLLPAGWNLAEPYDFKEYVAVMVWPEREERAFGRILNLDITFRKLIEILPA